MKKLAWSIKGQAMWILEWSAGGNLALTLQQGVGFSCPQEETYTVTMAVNCCNNQVRLWVRCYMNVVPCVFFTVALRGQRSGTMKTSERDNWEHGDMFNNVQTCKQGTLFGVKNLKQAPPIHWLKSFNAQEKQLWWVYLDQEVGL